MKKMQSDYEKEIQEAILVATRQTRYDAKMYVPFGKGGLKASIRQYNKGLVGKVIVGASYGPYQEYGTGTRVKVPSELSAYAMQFKGRGFIGKKPVFLGNKIGWRMIQFPVSIRPQPYLYPAFFLNRDRFIKDMDRRIDRIANRNWR